MGRFRIILEYQGRKYRGWQIQKNARTVQGEIVRVLDGIFGQGNFEFQGAGRTDAGVHALLQVAHLEVRERLAAAAIQAKLNQALPADINVLRVDPAPSRFHARHHAERRSYLYQVSRRRTAFAKNFVWWVADPLDLNAMREAGRLFLGMNDFRSFTDEKPDEKSTRVLVEDLQIVEEGSLVLIRVVGSHFIWKMVRRMVGVLVEVGRGRLNAADVESFLREESARPAELTAPASGLFLERVFYPGDEAPGPVRAMIRVDQGGK